MTALGENADRKQRHRENAAGHQKQTYFATVNK